MKKLAIQWFKQATDDLWAAEILMEREIYTVVCFHSQQCVEKSLKAVLQEKSIRPPRTHDIVTLKDRAENALGSVLDISLAEANFLSQIYAGSRYPPDIGLLPHSEPTQEDAKKALGIAERVFAQVEKLLEGK